MDIVAACKAAVNGRGLRVVLPEGEDDRILKAAVELARADLARPIAGLLIRPLPELAP